MYYIVKLLFNANVALFAGVTLATYVQFHGEVGFEWDYFMHDSIANILLTLLLLLLATRRSHWKSYLFLAGAACASAFQATFLMIYGLSIIFWYVYLNQKSQQKHSLWISAGMFGLGAVIITLIYGIINYAAGGFFFFFTMGFPGSKYLPHPLFPDGFWFLSDQGIILPIYLLCLSLIAFIYLKKKQFDHPYKTEILFCFMTFWLCVPIAVTFQIFGAPTLASGHFLLGMVQFVFLTLAAVFATFFPFPAKGTTLDRSAWVMILVIYALILGGLIFGLSLKMHLQQTIPRIAQFYSVARTTKLLLLLCAIGFLWKTKKLALYAPILFIAATLFLWDPFLVNFFWYKKIKILIGIFYLLFIWKNRHQLRGWSNYITLGVTLFIFFIPISPSFSFSPPLTLFPISPFIYLILITFLLLVLPVMFFIMSWKRVRKYTAITCLSLLFVVININADSLPLALYSPTFKCGFFKDQYMAILRGVQILSTLPSYPTFFWTHDAELIPHPSSQCRELNLASFYGKPAIQISDVYGSILMIITQLEEISFFSHPNQPDLLDYTIYNMPEAKKWAAVMPQWVKDMVPHGTTFRRYLRIKGGAAYSPCMDEPKSGNPLFDCKTENFWLHIFPKPFRMVFLVHNIDDANEAIKSLKKYGYYMKDRHDYAIKEGFVSYYIVMGITQKLKSAS